MAIVLLTTLLVPHMSMSSATDIAMQHTAGMTSHDGLGQANQREMTPGCTVACVGASLADLSFDLECVDIVVVAFIGMSVIANPTGRQIGPAERPPKFI